MRIWLGKGLRLGIVLLALLATIGTAAAQEGPMMAPPAAPYEAVPAPPPGAMVWRPGFWRWDGRAYVWAPGRYVRPPHPGAMWVAGHWVARGNHWVWRRGHWR